jgi:hypothetical protein
VRISRLPGTCPFKGTAGHPSGHIDLSADLLEWRNSLPAAGTTFAPDPVMPTKSVAGGNA